MTVETTSADSALEAAPAAAAADARVLGRLTLGFLRFGEGWGGATYTNGASACEDVPGMKGCIAPGCGAVTPPNTKGCVAGCGGGGTTMTGCVTTGCGGGGTTTGCVTGCGVVPMCKSEKDQNSQRKTMISMVIARCLQRQGQESHAHTCEFGGKLGCGFVAFLDSGDFTLFSFGYGDLPRDPSY